MPYFIFAIQSFGRLEQLGTCPTFPQASQQAKVLRAAQAPDEPRRIRVVFADDALTAQDLLLQPREAPPDGDD